MSEQKELQEELKDTAVAEVSENPIELQETDAKKDKEVCEDEEMEAPCEDDDMEAPCEDEEMEEPRTKNYAVNENSNKRNAIFIKQEFKDALLQTIGTLGFDRKLGSPELSIQVNQIFDILDQIIGKPLSEDDANRFISMISKAPYNVISGVMNNIRTNQKMYFEVREIGVPVVKQS